MEDDMSDREKPDGPDLYVGVTRGGRSKNYRLLAGTMVRGGSSAASVRLWVGIVLVFFGVMWTFDNLGWTAAGEVMRWWPALLLAYGLVRLSGLGLPRSTMQGAFFTIVGMLLVAARLASVHVGFGVIFPLALVMAGVSIVRRSVRGEGVVTEGETGDEVIRLTAVMGGATRRAVGTALQRAELCAVMGGLELDLREAQPAAGRIVVDAFACMGGIEIIVPETWRVQSDEIVPIAGAFEDRTLHSGDEPPACTLVLKGTAMMGGVVARNKPLSDREVHIVRRRRTPDGEDVREVHVSKGGVTVTTRRGDTARERPDDPGRPQPPISAQPPQ
jgi:hypothetical protein